MSTRRRKRKKSATNEIKTLRLSCSFHLAFFYRPEAFFNKLLVVCVENEGYAVSLEKRKIYVALSDPRAEKHGLARVIDESGEDYLYPRKFFREIRLPQSLKKAVLTAA